MQKATATPTIKGDTLPADRGPGFTPDDPAAAFDTFRRAIGAVVRADKSEVDAEMERQQAERAKVREDKSNVNG